MAPEVQTAWRPRAFATPADEPRARRASDLTLAGLALAGLVALGASADPLPGVARSLQALLASLPELLTDGWAVLVDLLGVLAAVLVVVAVARRRPAILRDQVLAAALAGAVTLASARVVTGVWPDAWEALRADSPPPWYPSLALALPGAAVLSTSPHLVRPLRRLARWSIGLATAGVVAIGAASVPGALAGLLTAVLAAAVVHLVFGSSGGTPGLAEVHRALAELGVPTRHLGAADRQAAGVFVVDATDAAGEPLIVKVYGRDAHDAAVLSTLWRTVWYREARTRLRVGRLQQVEHEAFVTLLAGQAGVPTDEVVTAGATASDDALLVLRRRGRPLADRSEATARGAWRALHVLHAARIGHGQVDDEHLVHQDGAIGIVGFGTATVAPTPVQAHTDEAQLLAGTAAWLGEERAVAVARDELGDGGLASVLPYLQPAALTAAQRRAVRASGVDLDRVRRAAAGATGTEPPPLLPLRRLTPGLVVRVVLPAIALLALVSAAAGLDLEALADGLRGATWWLVVLGFVATQVPRLTQAVSTLGASPVPLPLGPVYALQLAVSYVNLAVPSSAARVAVNIRFFQRQGVAPGAALAAGALDGFGGFVVQALILAGLLLLTPASLDLDGRAAGAAARIGLVAVAVGLVALAVVWAVPRVRRFVTGWVGRLVHEAVASIRGLRSFRRLGLLFGGNLATELLFANALGIFTRALGYPLGLDELLLINISVALLAGLLPVPGGIGVAEGGLTFGLVRAGLPEEVAFVAVICSRLSSFYLPPLWGYAALRWLERNDHL